MEETIPEIDVESLSWLPRIVAENPQMGLWIYLAIVALSIVVFNLGFARKLPILKVVIVYIALFVGCIIMFFLALMGAPIIEVLLISTAILGIYKLRLLQRKREEARG
ncbi:YlaH-like family protein [Alkalihalobacillus sp. BA299]|uniref:YlaH-like family protein n=1 Tax=Alkalihalobacillus sp. BA299 TaxID=2815938 RepID=UPI0027DCEE97|nr:YlaH-like family protein [Alkalihalobacillus sp. BA299]